MTTDLPTTIDLTQFTPPITLIQAYVCFNQLVNHPVLENPRRCLAGLKAIRRLFMTHIMQCKTKTGLSFADAMRDPVAREKFEKIAERYKRGVYPAFQLWCGCINIFRPVMAKWLYTKYEVKVGVLDFSAGWGSRLLGALAVGIPYTGIDTNRELIEPYQRLVTDYNPKKSPVTMIWDKAENVDFSEMDYDMCLTSPPYYTLEKYQHMPEYTSKKDFYDTFLIPVVTKAFRYLKPNGHMVLNMPVELYEAVKNVLPPLHDTLEYYKSDRHSAMKKSAKHTRSYEHIYVWKKC